MGVEPPFIYDKPSSYTFAGPTHRGFNPKAVTQASWSPPAPKPKKDGPLIDFNRHPDSYLIVPYGNLNVAPMNPKTKDRVKRLRRVQLAFRVVGLVGALGLLFCVIAVNNTSTPVAWIIRVGPAVALCHCLYAIYHLCRDVSTRPPASCASYMLFAAMLDTGLIPFFAFSAIMANTDYNTDASGWGTLFTNYDITHKIIYAFFLACCVEGGLLAVSLVIDIYLATIFRKIAKLPPDMNPLEDNLTARPNPKHKRNKSSLNFEKHLSGSTLATQRMSQMTEGSNFKRVPYVHTRTDSADSITLYGNEKASNSRLSFRNDIREANADPYRYSGVTSRDSPSPTRPSSAITPAANARAPGAGLDHKPVRSSMLAPGDDQPPSWLSYASHDGTPTKLSNTARQQLNDELRPLSPVSMLSENDMPVNYHQKERQNWYQGTSRNSAHVDLTQIPLNRSPVSTPDPEEQHIYQDTLTVPTDGPKRRSREPLGMHPPTPVQNDFEDENIYHTPAQHPSTPQRTALNDVHANSSNRPGMGSRPSSFIGSGGKSRYYGDLRNSLGGSPTRESFETPTTHPQIDDRSSLYSRTKTMESEDSGNFRVYDSEDDDDDSDLEDHQQQLARENKHRYIELQNQTDSIMLGLPHEQDQWNDSRKVSNSTGYDLKTGYAGLGAEFGQGMARRREVSGKVAEEGRGGAGYGNIGYSEVRDGAVMTGQAKRNGAAGWARFHGL